VYKVRSSNIIPLYERVKSLSSKFRKIVFEYIPRYKVSRADSLANRALDIKGRYPPIL
jgi:ribonuclease HI